MSMSKPVVISSPNSGRSASVRINYDDGVMGAIVDIYNDRRKKEKSYTLTVDLTSLLKAYQRGAAMNDAQVGFGLGDIVSAAESVVAKVGAKEIVNTVSKVVDAPIVGDALKSAIPGLGIANSAWKAANALNTGVKAGDAHAVEGIKQVAQLAKNGDTPAKKILVATKILNLAGAKTKALKVMEHGKLAFVQTGSRKVWKLVPII